MVREAAPVCQFPPRRPRALAVAAAVPAAPPPVVFPRRGLPPVSACGCGRSPVVGAPQGAQQRAEAHEGGAPVGGPRVCRVPHPLAPAAPGPSTLAPEAMSRLLPWVLPSSRPPCHRPSAQGAPCPPLPAPAARRPCPAPRVVEAEVEGQCRVAGTGACPHASAAGAEAGGLALGAQRVLPPCLPPQVPPQRPMRPWELQGPLPYALALANEFEKPGWPIPEAAICTPATDRHRHTRRETAAS